MIEIIEAIDINKLKLPDEVSLYGDYLTKEKFSEVLNELIKRYENEKN